MWRSRDAFRATGRIPLLETETRDIVLRQYYRKNMATATCFPADTRPALVEFSLLESWLASSSALQLPLHQIESQQQAKGREVQRLLLQAHLQHRGNGDIGPALQLEQAGGAILYSHRRLNTRSLTTVFGTVELVRMGYSRPNASSIFPLDKALAGGGVVVLGIC